MSTIKPIETQYKGYRFRSRLEARWAVFFDAMGLAWDYEPEGYDLGDAGWYLPDFYLREWGMWVEIKPQMPSEGELYKMWKLAGAFKGEEQNALKEHLILCGTPGKPSITFGYGDFPICVRDGYVALTVTGGLVDGKPMVVPSCFAMVAGGKELDIWPMYMDDDFVVFPHTFKPVDVRGNNPHLFSLSLFHGTIRRLYVGKGVMYYKQNLMMAYQTAKSARFEHGEKPKVHP